MNSPTTQKRTIVGSGKLRFAADANWCRLPEGEELGEVIGVATDSHDRVFLFTRTPNRLRVFDREGNFLYAWDRRPVRPPAWHSHRSGRQRLSAPTIEDHTVRRYTPDGRLLLTLGVSGRPSDTGATSHRLSHDRACRPAVPLSHECGPLGRGRHLCLRRLRQCADPPFQSRRPIAPLVGSARRRTGPVPRAAWHRDRFRGHRLGGRPRKQSHSAFHARRPVHRPVDRRGSALRDVHRPRGPHLCRRARLSRRHVRRQCAPSPNASGGRMSIFSPQGELLARWGGGENPCAPGDFCRSARRLDRFAWRFLCQRSQLHDRHPPRPGRSRQPHAAKVHRRIGVSPLVVCCRIGEHALQTQLRNSGILRASDTITTARCPSE